MKFITKILVLSGACYLSAILLPGIHLLNNFWSVVGVAVVIALLNSTIAPILNLFTLPINVLSFGLFSLIINTLMILLAGSLLHGIFVVDGFWAAFWFSILMTVFNNLANSIIGKEHNA